MLLLGFLGFALFKLLKLGSVSWKREGSWTFGCMECGNSMLFSSGGKVNLFFYWYI